jgi:hypothetical protein
VNKLQRKYLQSNLVMILLIAFVIVFQDDKLAAQLAFIPVIVYAALNYKFLQKIERFGPSPKEVIESNTVVKTITIGLLGIEISFIYYCFLAGSDISTMIDGIGILLLAIMGPLLPALLASRIMLFRRLGVADYNY